MSIILKPVTMYQLDIPNEERRWFETRENAIDYAENSFNQVFRRSVLEQMPENMCLTGSQTFELLKKIHEHRDTLLTFLTVLDEFDGD